MMYTFDISNLDYLMPQNSKFEISTIYDKNAEIRKSKTQFFNRHLAGYKFPTFKTVVL